MYFLCPFHDLPRILFSITFITLISIGCFWIIQPFIIGFSWASMVVIATWPLLIKIQQILWGRRSLAVITMTLLLLLFFVLPISLLLSSIMNNSAQLVVWATYSDSLKLLSLAWLQNIPMIGQKLYNLCESLTSVGSILSMNKVQPYIYQFSSWLLEQVTNLGYLLLHCILMILFSVLLYMHGEKVALIVQHLALLLDAKRGNASVILAMQAIRAVALGVVLTAIVQALLGGIGLAMTGIPFVTMLTIIMFMLCIAQLGPLPILIPAMIWLYWNGDTTWGTVLLIWSCVVAVLDNVLRLVLIHMEADLPVLLILCGVLGGLLAFGMIGVFIGPVVLAVSWRLAFTWIQEEVYH